MFLKALILKTRALQAPVFKNPVFLKAQPFKHPVLLKGQAFESQNFQKSSTKQFGFQKFASFKTRAVDNSVCKILISTPGVLEKPSKNEIQTSAGSGGGNYDSDKVAERIVVKPVTRTPVPSAVTTCHQAEAAGLCIRKPLWTFSLAWTPPFFILF